MELEEKPGSQGGARTDPGRARAEPIPESQTSVNKLWQDPVDPKSVQILYSMSQIGQYMELMSYHTGADQLP